MRFLSMKDVQQALGMSRQAVYEAMRRENNPLVMFRVSDNGKWRISDKDFNQWLDRCERSGPQH